MDLQLFIESAPLTRTLYKIHGNKSSFVMKRLYFLAVAAAVIALSEAEECPPLRKGEKKFLPHENDCHKYYECANGVPKQERDCPNLGDKKWCFDKTISACVVDKKSCDQICKPTPGGGGNDSCPTSDKCKMYYSDNVVEVCVKKDSAGALSKFY